MPYGFDLTASSVNHENNGTYMSSLVFELKNKSIKAYKILNLCVDIMYSRVELSDISITMRPVNNHFPHLKSPMWLIKKKKKICLCL